MTRFDGLYLLGKKSFRSLAGVDATTFLAMVERLLTAWREKVVEPKDRDGRPWGIGGLEDHLLVLLILYRCAATQDFLACLYGVNQSAISRAVARIEKPESRMLRVKRGLRMTREIARLSHRVYYFKPLRVFSCFRATNVFQHVKWPAARRGYFDSF